MTLHSPQSGGFHTPQDKIAGPKGSAIFASREKVDKKAPFSPFLSRNSQNNCLRAVKRRANGRPPPTQTVKKEDRSGERLSMSYKKQIRDKECMTE